MEVKPRCAAAAVLEGDAMVPSAIADRNRYLPAYGRQRWMYRRCAMAVVRIGERCSIPRQGDEASTQSRFA